MVIDKDKIFGIAQKYIQKGQSKKAIQEYIKLIDASPKDKRLYLKLGDLYLKNGENNKAIKEYLRLANLYIEEDLNLRAISIYKKVLAIEPKFVEAIYKIAQLYLKEGLLGDAKSSYQDILRINPHDREALEAFQNIEKRQADQPQEVHKLLPKEEPHRPKRPHLPEIEVIEEKPTPPPPSSPSTAPPHIFTYEAELSSPDKDAEMHYHLGIAYKEMELFDYAISEFELASSNHSMRFDSYTMLGSCLMDKGDYDRSIEFFKMATEIRGVPDQKLARLHYNLGLAYESKGMIAEAIKSYRNALQLDHSFSEVQEKLRTLQPFQK